MNINPKNRTWIIYIVIMLVLFFLISSQFINFNPAPAKDSLTTSEFVQAVEKGNVVKVVHNTYSGTLEGDYLKDGAADPAQATAFESTYVGEDSLNELMARHPEVTFNINTSNPDFWMPFLSSGLMILLVVGLGIFFLSQFNQANNKQMQFGKTKAKKTEAERPKTKFSDVAGIDEAVEELQEIKEFLSNPQRFQELGARIPHGVLLVGPPGTGKTLLARAVAGEAGVPFFSISGSDFVEMFVGVGASRVRDLFEKAKQSSPSIIFIDEIDAVGHQRGAGLGGGHDEREQTLNQLLVEMDGFEDNSSVILIAATNRADILDPALLRPGRFDRQIVVDRPDLKGRAQILKVHSEGKPLAHSVDLERLARLTPGFTGADLANLMNEAALLTARKGKKLVTMTELSEAMEREIAGPERKGRVITEKEKRTIAYHESGHALVGHLLENSDPVHKISIISRGQALGYTLSLPTEDRFLNSREEMFDDLAVFLGGRVAEEIFCDDITTGASNDLERATKMARQMVTRYGMTEALGTQVYGEANHEVFLGRDYGATPDYSEATAQRIDEEVAKIMVKAHDRAHEVLTTNAEQMELMAAVLIERETVEGEALEALLENTWSEYLENEEDILARQAAELKQQEEDDERRRLEQQSAAAAEQQAKGEAGTGPNAAPPNAATRYSIEDIFSGKVTPEELFEAQRRALRRQAPPEPAKTTPEPPEVPETTPQATPEPPAAPEATAKNATEATPENLSESNSESNPKPPRKTPRKTTRGARKEQKQDKIVQEENDESGKD